VKGYKLFWSDEFNGTTLDNSKWIYRGLGKRDEAYITKESVSLDGKGCMIMEVSRRGDSILTGMIATENIFSTRYGYFECRAALTTTPGTFPAFWLQSPTISNENGNTTSNGAEIDIFEYFPHTKRDSVAHTLHYGGYGSGHRVAGPVWGALKNTKSGFHTFGLEWTPNSYKTFVDGVQTFSGDQLVSGVAEFIILSLGVNTAAAGPLQYSSLPDRFIVDYVRVYKKENTEIK
nr:glycoside hydrolase family 16 protein [Chitinophagaceae bacterium]